MYIIYTSYPEESEEGRDSLAVISDERLKWITKLIESNQITLLHSPPSSGKSTLGQLLQDFFENCGNDSIYITLAGISGKAEIHDENLFDKFWKNEVHYTLTEISKWEKTIYAFIDEIQIIYNDGTPFFWGTLKALLSRHQNIHIILLGTYQPSHYHLATPIQISNTLGLNALLLTWDETKWLIMNYIQRHAILGSPSFNIPEQVQEAIFSLTGGHPDSVITTTHAFYWLHDCKLTEEESKFIRGKLLNQPNVPFSANYASNPIVEKFYRSAITVIPMNTSISADVGAVFGSAGFLDFYVDGELCWGIELTHEGTCLKEHAKQFEEGGKYADIPLKQWAVLDFQHYSKKVKKLVPNFWYVFYSDDYKSVAIKRDKLDDITLYLQDKVQISLIQVEKKIEINLEENVSKTLQHLGFATTGIKQTVGSTYGGNYKLNWIQPPRNVLVVKKPMTKATTEALMGIVMWLNKRYPSINVILEPDVAKDFEKELPFVYVIPPGRKDEYTRAVDFVVTLGGDGTILHVSSLFNHCVPPIISFSMGTLGFLLPFHIKDYQTALNDVIRGDVSLLLRMRLACSVWAKNGTRIKRTSGLEIGDMQAMNEVNLHRGRYPHLTNIECFVDGQYLTNAVADGLIVATPTGSTAYSLSAGGPIIHPSVQNILLTPICPRSLSFRTIILPPTSKIQMRIGEESRAPTEVTVDATEICLLNNREYLEVQMSPYPIPSINRVNEGVDWAKDINELLKWNQNFVHK
ncbi:8737_t:CDS:10 [Entrophospora sp. SA101]|nr:8737_t:CDS:10 [Entrophospora sp. SA101]